MDATPRPLNTHSGRSWTIAGLDGRTVGGRRFRELMAVFLSDLGGEQSLDSLELSQVRLAAALMAVTELMTTDALNSGKVEPEQFSRMANGAARLLASLKASHRAANRKGVNPTRTGAAPSALQSYLNGKADKA
jgi:hypothetical protein